jgi:class 3 adenylate cyclase/tetratricopeptide (TPR) repeat protein
MPALSDWLASIGLLRYAERFAQDQIDLDVLAELTEADLERLGVALGDRKRLLKAIRGLPAAGAAEAAPAPLVELRQVTILFADLSGYTELTTALGAEATHRLVQRFYAVVNEIVRSHHGSIERHIGDAVMAAFGLPLAHSNDPERALRTAQAIHAAMPALSAEFGRELAVHVGIASGQVVASRSHTGGDFATVGDAVNLAARLVGLAPPGATVLSDAVHRAVDRLVTADLIGEVAVKGFEQPVRAWRLLAWRAERRDRQPLVGRDSELQAFAGQCATVREQRRGVLVLVCGEAGMGKTRLLEAFTAHAAESGFACHLAVVLDFGAGLALDPIARLAASLLAMPAAARPEDRHEALERGRRHGLIGEGEEMFAADLLDLPLAEPQRATYAAIDSATRARRRVELLVQLVGRASASAPQLLVIEDVHWANPEILQTIAAITHGIGKLPVALVLSTRLEGDPMASPWRAQIASTLPVHRFQLHPLAQAEALQLAGALGSLDRAAIERAVLRAGGNPLFLEQLLRNAAAGEEDSVPGSIQSIVLARLDRLPALDRRALQAASVLGQFFSLPLLRFLIDEPGYECDTPLAEQLVRQMGDELLFAHALIREGTYVSLLAEQKRHWHGKAAEWFAQRDPMLTAEHLERAQDARAAGAYLRAARAEEEAHRPERALYALERGAALATQPIEQVALLSDLARVQASVGRARDALASYERLLELAQDGAQRALACVGMADALRLLDRSSEALQWLERAERAADADLDHAVRSRIHNLRGSLRFPLGNFDLGMVEQTRALEHARSAGSIELQLRALSGLGDAHYGAGRLASSYRCFDECVALSRRHHIVQVEAANLPMLAICSYFMADIGAGLTLAGEGLQLARRVLNRRAQMVAHHASCILLLEIMDTGSAKEHALAANDIARSIGATRFVPEGMMFLADCLAQEGDRAAARTLMREALELARDQINYCGPWIYGGLATLAQSDNERRQSLREGERILAAGAPAHNHVGFYTGAIEASLAACEWDEALRYCEALDLAFRAERPPLVEFKSAQGRLLARLGRGATEPGLRAELSRLLEQAARARMVVSLRALEAAAARLA